MKRLLFVVFLISAPVALVAQQAENLLNGLQFVAPLQIATGQDSNFLVDRTNPNERLLVLSLPPSIQPGAPDIRPKILDDQFLMLTMPKLAFQDESKRHDLILTWVPEFELFRQNHDLNAFNQQAMAGFNYFLGRNVQVSVGDSFTTSHDPARTLQSVFLLLPRGKYRENAIRGSLDFQPNALTSFGVRYDTTHTTFGQTDQFQARNFDSISSGYTFSVTRMLNRNHRLRGTYAIVKMAPINHQARNDDAVDTSHLFEQMIHSATLEYRAGISPGTVLEFGGGLIRLDTGVNYTFRATIDKRLKTYYWFAASYSRSLTFLTPTISGFAPGLGSNGFYDLISFRLKGQPTRKTAILFDTSIARSASNLIIESNKGLMGRARFDYRLSDRNVLFASAETYQQNRNAYVLAPLARNRFTVGIEISLSSDAQRRLGRFNEDAQNVALTDHARRRQQPE